jgi:hypothetical protein
MKETEEQLRSGKGIGTKVALEVARVPRKGVSRKK